MLPQESCNMALGNRAMSLAIDMGHLSLDRFMVVAEIGQCWLGKNLIRFLNAHFYQQWLKRYRPQRMQQMCQVLEKPGNAGSEGLVRSLLNGARKPSSISYSSFKRWSPADVSTG